MGDVGERSAMDEGRIALQRLDEVGCERVLEQHGHRPRRLELGRGHRTPVAGVADDHAAQPALEVGQVGGEAEHRHHLGGHGDVEAVLAREAVRHAAQTGDDLAQRAVVHVDGPAPRDPALVEALLVAPINVVVEHRRQQVVGTADGVEVAGEVQVDLLHRHHLGVAAAGRTALHAEAGPQRRLAQGDDGLLADPVEAVAQAHRGGGLALAGRRRVDRGDQDQLAVGAVGPGCRSSAGRAWRYAGRNAPGPRPECPAGPPRPRSAAAGRRARCRCPTECSIHVSPFLGPQPAVRGPLACDRCSCGEPPRPWPERHSGRGVFASTTTS